MSFEQDLARSTFAWAEDGSIIITSAMDHALSMARIINVTGKVIASTERLFDVREQRVLSFSQVTGKVIASTERLRDVREQGGRSTPLVTDLGRELFNCCRSDFKSINKGFRDFRLNPLYDLLEAHAAEVNQGESRIRAGMVDRCNKAVARLRKAAKEGEVKRVCANMKRTLSKSSRRIDDLVGALRMAYSKVVVVRIDLVYRCKVLKGCIPEEPEATLEQVQRDRDAFVVYMTTGPFKNVLAGYAWRLEYGIGGTGWHLHVAAFFDGQKVRKDIMLGNHLGRHWREHITGGRGQSHNCNREKESYPRCGLGMFPRGDDEGWDRVRNDAMSYLEKADWYARFKVGPKVKLFDSGGPYREPR